MGRITAMIGGQWGSEGKGVIAAHIAHEYDYHVRVGAPNAGHSFLGPDPITGRRTKLWKMQTIPCGWINPKATLLIGAGGLVDPELLMREASEIAEVDPTIWDRLFIDPACGVLDARFHEQEGGVNGEMHKRIGSTGEGVGPAREARISRDPQRFRLFKDLQEWDHRFRVFRTTDVAGALWGARMMEKSIFLEGAQGQGLSLIHGPWPYCTSTDPGPAQLCADAGLPPTALTDVLAVFRTFPIRVAGNSGPLPNEITWEELAKETGIPGLCERTTVTKKVRRVARWSDDIAQRCKMLHAPTMVAVTFMDYLDPANAGTNDLFSLSYDAIRFLQHVEETTGAVVKYVGTGGPDLTVITRPQV